MAVRRLIVVLTAVFFTAASCDLFLLPKRGRDNPNDPDNPVAPMEDFSAVAVSQTEVLLSLAVPTLQDQSRLPAGFIVVRKVDKFPEGPDDKEGNIIDKSLETVSGRIYIKDTDLEPQTAYKYAVWSYGANELSDHYTFSGSDSARTLNPPTDLETITTFSAWPYAIDAVYLEWGYTDTGIEEPPSNLIVRKEGSSPPLDIYDGTAHYAPAGGSSIQDYGLTDNTEYTYGIWPADEDGTPYPFEATGGGPFLTASVVIAPLFVSLQATDVVTIRESDWNGSPSSLQVKSDGSPQSAALVRFDLSGLYGKFIGTIISGKLLLMSQTITKPGSVEVFRTVTDWDESSGYFWDVVTTEGVFYIDDGYNLTVFVDKPGEYFSWDIEQNIRNKADGFLFLGDPDPLLQADLSFDPSGGSGPRLDLLYFGEP